jgi:hypothetical protein
LEQLLFAVEKDVALSAADMQARAAVAAKLDAILKKCVPGSLYKIGANEILGFLAELLTNGARLAPLGQQRRLLLT